MCSLKFLCWKLNSQCSSIGRRGLGEHGDHEVFDGSGLMSLQQGLLGAPGVSSVSLSVSFALLPHEDRAFFSPFTLLCVPAASFSADTGTLTL